MFFCQAGFSQEMVGQDSTLRIVKNKKKLVGFPAVLHSPEFSWAFGGAGSYNFRFKRKDSLIRTSFVQAFGIVTLRKQLVFGIDGNIFFPKELFILRIHASISRFPDRFWGLGNNSRDEDRENYAISQYYLFPQLLRNVYRKFYVGAAYESQNVFSFEYQQKANGDPSIFDQQNVAGRKGSFISGLGVLLLWDSRNNAFSSSRGSYFQYYISQFSSILGSQFNYFSQILDARKFTSLSRTTVLAFQVLAHLNQGDVPIRSMANIGSASIMRGYYEGRYTHKNLIAAQCELRQNLISRFGVVAFVGLGRVASEISAFTLTDWKPSYGGGIRVALDESEKLNIRVDFGYGHNESGVYLNLSEAF